MATPRPLRWIVNPLRPRRCAEPRPPVRAAMAGEPRRRIGAWLALLAGLLLACDSDTPSEPPERVAAASAMEDARSLAAERTLREPAEPRCANYRPDRMALFGDLHVHTGLSADAFATDTRVTPDEAYAFARGEALRIAPLDAEGNGTRVVRLERPLDFAALTDHAENFGEVAICTDPTDPAYASDNCVGYRTPVPAERAGNSIVLRMARLMGVEPMVAARNVDVVRPAAVCGLDGARCAAASRSVWQSVQAAAERWDDPSEACEFSTLIAYEWTLTPNFTKIHRNVIFRNTQVPDAPISSLDEPTAPGLWRRLREECLDAGTGCDVLAIPHNSNLSNGHLFAAEIPADAPLDVQARLARERARLEPLVEIMQVKGDSECRNGLSGVVSAPDEYCAFEEFRPAGTEDCEDATGQGALAGQGCVSRVDYVRNALTAGLAEAERLGTNPFEFGLIASTDTHNGTPGDVEEYSFDGAGGFRDADPIARLGIAESTIVVPDLLKNPGGLVGVWAEENARESIFRAMKRRETFGTSGPRIAVRFFGGWAMPEAICDAASLAEQGYARGVPMGSRLSTRPETASAPRFVVSALRDPGIEGHPGGLLQRIQIIKGWVGQDGSLQQAVYDVAGGPNAARVDIESCEVSGPGANSLCSVWQDPDFDPSRRAFYYARVLENPSCRWSGWECLRLRESLDANALPNACSLPDARHTIQERAWSSPIWYEPDSAV